MLFSRKFGAGGSPPKERAALGPGARTRHSSLETIVYPDDVTFKELFPATKICRSLLDMLWWAARPDRQCTEPLGTRKSSMSNRAAAGLRARILSPVLFQTAADARLEWIEKINLRESQSNQVVDGGCRAQISQVKSPGEPAPVALLRRAAAGVWGAESPVTSSNGADVMSRPIFETAK